MLRPMPKRSGFIVRVATFCLATVWLAACGGGDDKTLAGYSEECTRDEDCKIDFICVGSPGLCTIECPNGDGACKPLSPTGVCTEGHCYDKCTAETQSCPNPKLTCTMSTTVLGTCRP
jgi:hypothetical protein